MFVEKNRKNPEMTKDLNFMVSRTDEQIIAEIDNRAMSDARFMKREAEYMTGKGAEGKVNEERQKEYGKFIEKSIGKVEYGQKQLPEHIAVEKMMTAFAGLVHEDGKITYEEVAIVLQQMKRYETAKGAKMDPKAIFKQLGIRDNVLLNALKFSKHGAEMARLLGIHLDIVGAENEQAQKKMIAEAVQGPKANKTTPERLMPESEHKANQSYGAGVSDNSPTTTLDKNKSTQR